MAKKKTPTNGKSTQAKASLAPVPVVVGPTLREMKHEMEAEIRAFTEYLVKKYAAFHGHDLRRDVSWFMEQMGISVHHDLEQAKLAERKLLIAETQAREKAEEEAKK